MLIIAQISIAFLRVSKESTLGVGIGTPNYECDSE